MAEGPARPKRHDRAIRRLAAGLSVEVTDPALRTALFLRSHPAWTPDDLERADPDLIDLLRALDAAVAKVQQAQQREG